MGESFIGFPNRHRNIGSNSPATLAENLMLEYTYNPDHYLSAHYGYRLATEYVCRLGGLDYAMQGSFYTKRILPEDSENSYNIGSEETQYGNIYGNEFSGTASKAKELAHPVRLLISGSVTGEVGFTGKEATIEVSVRTNHDHNDKYLQLTGGTMTGDIVFKNGTGLVDSYNRSLFDIESSTLSIGQGRFNKRAGQTRIYSWTSLSVYAPSLNIPSSVQHSTSFNIVMGSDNVKLETNLNSYLTFEKNNLKFNGNTVYTTANLNIGTIQTDIDSITKSISTLNKSVSSLNESITQVNKKLVVEIDSVRTDIKKLWDIVNSRI